MTDKKAETKQVEIKMSNREGEIILQNPGINKFLDRDSNDVPGKVLYWVARIRNKLKTELKPFFVQAEKERSKCAAQMDGKPERDVRGNYIPDPSKLSDLIKELETLGNQEFSLPGVFWLDLDFEGDVAEWGITGKEIEGIMLLTQQG